MPRYKTCGGGIVERARRRLEVDLDGVFERSCERVVLGPASPRRELVVQRSHGVVHMTMRAALDQRLAAEAREAGAEVVEGCEVRGLREVGERVVLATSLGDLQARLVVGADGITSRVAKLAGWPAIEARAPALECEVDVEPADLERLSAAARFDLGIPAGGYAWVFPKRTHLSIGVVRMQRGPARLDEALAIYLGRLGTAPPRHVERHAWSIPLAPRPGGLARGRVLLVGDAAGLADPLTAEGIGPALESGRAVAAAIAEADLEPGRAASLYEQRLESELLAELRAADRLATLLYRRPRLRALAFSLRGRALAELFTDVVTGERSYASVATAVPAWLRWGARLALR
jgi:flavin-dependent dehydrogenase